MVHRVSNVGKLVSKLKNPSSGMLVSMILLQAETRCSFCWVGDNAISYSCACAVRPRPRALHGPKTLPCATDTREGEAAVCGGNRPRASRGGADTTRQHDARNIPRTHQSDSTTTYQSIVLFRGAVVFGVADRREGGKRRSVCVCVLCWEVDMNLMKSAKKEEERKSPKRNHAYVCLARIYVSSSWREGAQLGHKVEPAHGRESLRARARGLHGSPKPLPIVTKGRRNTRTRGRLLFSHLDGDEDQVDKDVVRSLPGILLHARHRTGATLLHSSRLAPPSLLLYRLAGGGSVPNQLLLRSQKLI